MKITIETGEEKAVISVDGEKIIFCRDQADDSKPEKGIFIYPKDYVYPEDLMDKTVETGGV